MGTEDKTLRRSTIVTLSTDSNVTPTTEGFTIALQNWRPCKSAQQKTTLGLLLTCKSKVAVVFCTYKCVFVWRKATRQKAGSAVLLEYRNKKLLGYSLTYVQHACSHTQFQTFNITCGE